MPSFVSTQRGDMLRYAFLIHLSIALFETGSICLLPLFTSILPSFAAWIHQEARRETLSWCHYVRGITRTQCHLSFLNFKILKQLFAFLFLL